MALSCLHMQPFSSRRVLQAAVRLKSTTAAVATVWPWGPMASPGSKSTLGRGPLWTRLFPQVHNGASSSLLPLFSSISSPHPFFLDVCVCVSLSSAHLSFLFSHFLPERLYLSFPLSLPFFHSLSFTLPPHLVLFPHISVAQLMSE